MTAGTMWLCPLLIVTFLLTLAVVVPLERRRLRRARAAFAARRSGMADEDFLRQLGAEPEQVPFYLAGRRFMAELSAVPAEMVRPDDTVRSLLDLQFDSGYIQDFLFALQDELGGTFGPGYPDYPPRAMTFGAYLRELARCWRPLVRIVLRLDPSRLTNPAAALRRVLPEFLAECSGGTIRGEGHGTTADGTAMLLYLRAEGLDEALACIADVVENVPVLDNDLRPALVAAVRRPEGYQVVYPRDFRGPFPA
jgi:hypothetical protein